MKDLLPLNENGADKEDYNVARDQVHRDANLKFSLTDTRMYDARGNYLTPPSQTDDNTEYKKELIEYKYCTRDESITLFANDYPLYIGPNPFGFIPFEILSATDPQYTLDCE